MTDKKETPLPNLRGDAQSCDRGLVELSAGLRRPVVIDLFSGAGGLGLGFESAGFEVVSAVEYDPVHAATHLFNFPLTDVLCRDIATVSRTELLESATRGWDLHNPNETWNGVVDVIIGGPSCQGFSTMGKRDATDERNQLIFEFVRLVELVKPRAFCMENVPGLLDPRFDGIRSKALGRLKAAGYRISGDDSVLNAEDYGVPQKRRRVLILGVLEGSAPRTPSKSISSSHTVADAFAALPHTAMYGGLESSDTLRMSAKANATRRAKSNRYMELAGILGDGSDAFGHRRQFEELEMSGCKRTSHSAETIERFKSTPPGTKEPVSRLYKLSASAAALTLRAGTGRERGAFSAARPLHPSQPRVITVREAARLHSFPDWFRFHVTNWHGHRQIGNAVPPLLAKAAADSLMAALGLTPSKSQRSVALGDPELLALTPTAAALRLGANRDQVPFRRRPEMPEDSSVDSPAA